MKIDAHELQEKINIANAAAQAKKAGAQVSPAVAATIRNAWKEKVPISVIRTALREMGVPMSPTMISKIAKSPTPRRKRGLAAQNSGPVEGGGVVSENGPGNQGPFRFGVATFPSEHRNSNNTSATRSPMENLAAANPSSRRGP